MKYLLCISYEGTCYHGWQVQPGCSTVQQTLQDACRRVFVEGPSITGCSRTDSGVHALNFYCTAEGKTSVPVDKLPTALNTLLPDDIAVKSACVVNDEFHPRYSCNGKEYMYDICISEQREPLKSRYSWQLCRKLDLERMKAAAKQIVGKHDFAAFCASGSSVVDTIRTVREVRIEENGDHLLLYISADGFLYNMVRIIVGTLVDVGLHRDTMTIDEILYSRDRSNAGRTAPANGLFLNQVFYGALK